MKRLFAAALAVSVLSLALPLHAKTIHLDGVMPLKSGGSVRVDMCVEINETGEETITAPAGDGCDEGAPNSGTDLLPQVLVCVYGVDFSGQFYTDNYAFLGNYPGGACQTLHGGVLVFGTISLL